MTIEKYVAVATNSVLVDGNAITLVNNAFAYCFKETRLSTTSGSDMEHNKDCGHFSTIIRALAIKDGDILSQFDRTDESRDEIRNTSPKHHSIDNDDVAANKGKLKDTYH